MSVKVCYVGKEKSVNHFSKCKYLHFIQRDKKRESLSLNIRQKGVAKLEKET